jgi:Tol biopolymer transport system component
MPIRGSIQFVKAGRGGTRATKVPTRMERLIRPKSQLAGSLCGRTFDAMGYRRGACLVFLLFVVANGAGESSIAKRSGKIVFAARVGGVDLSRPVDLYTVNADGSRLRRLTHDRVTEASPVWSPDGKAIAYKTTAIVKGATFMKNALFTIASRGGKRRMLVSSAALAAHGIKDFYDLSWSPDGRRLAFTGRWLGNAVVAWWSLNGRFQFVSGPSGSAFHPTWSPDGKRLAYGTERGIVVIPSTSRGDQFPLWSPDGRWIAVQHYAKHNNKEIDSLDVLSPSGNARRRIFSALFISPSAWSPTSDGILFLRRGGALPESTSRLFYVSLHGGRPQPVPGTPNAIGGASWHR